MGIGRGACVTGAAAFVGEGEGALLRGDDKDMFWLAVGVLVGRTNPPP